MRRSLRSWPYGACWVLAVLSGGNFARAETCVSPSSGDFRVCLAWSAAGDPVQNTNFAVQFHDPDPPDVQLKTGDDGWVIYVQNTSDNSPGDLASLTLDPTVSTDDFVVKIAHGTGAGAANVGTIDLTASGWTGSSSTTSASRITGDLTGDLTLQADSNGDGGVLDLRIDGDVTSTATITAPAVDSLHVGLTAFDFYVGTIAGAVILPNSIRADGIVGCGALDGTIDLGGGRLEGTVYVESAGTGAIVDGGTIAGPTLASNGGLVRLGASFSGNTWSGTADFAAVEPAGVILVDGVDGGGCSGRISIAGDMDGTMLFNKALLSGGEIDIQGNLGGQVLLLQYAALAGIIHVGGDVHLTGREDAVSSIVVEGFFTGRVRIDGSLVHTSSSSMTPEILMENLVFSGSAITVDYDGWNDGDDWDTGAVVSYPNGGFSGNSPDDHVWEVQPCKGDMNNDGVLDNFDIDPFVLALVSPSVYAGAFPGLEGSRVYHGDCDCSSAFNNLDIDPFIWLLENQCCTMNCAPGLCAEYRAIYIPSAEAVAVRLGGNVASERFAALVAIVEAAAFSEDSPNPEFWADVLNHLGE